MISPDLSDLLICIICGAHVRPLPGQTAGPNSTVTCVAGSTGRRSDRVHLIVDPDLGAGS